MIIKNIFILFIIEYFLFNVFENKVIFVFEHFRHGARSPLDISENDLDLIREQWNGSQELTNVGLRQEYLLGHFIRNKYPNLINYEKYNPKEIEVLSTMTNRTIMSARAQLNGIFNNSIKNKIEEKQKNLCSPKYLLNEVKKLNDNIISIYPDNFPEEVPVHIIDVKEKLFQLEKNDICPKYKNMRNYNKQREEIKDFILMFNDSFGEQLLKIYNIKDKNYYMDFENVNDICIETMIDKFDDREFNFFNNQIDLEALYNVSLRFFDLKTTFVYSNNKNGSLAYIGSSILIRKILSYMENIINNIDSDKNQPPKLVLLSSHDTAIANMEGLLDNLFEIQIIPPSYSSNYIFELVKNEDNDEYIVNLIFNNITLKTIEYNIFKNKIKRDSWTYEKIGKFCGFVKEESSNIINKYKEKRKWIIIIIIFSLLDFLIFLFILYLLIAKKYIKLNINIFKKIKKNRK